MPPKIIKKNCQNLVVKKLFSYFKYCVKILCHDHCKIELDFISS